MAGVGARSRPTFNDSQPPPNYVPGLGRGAVGFTTRSDIGPARPALDAPDALQGLATAPPAGYVAGRGRGMGELAREQGELAARPDQGERDYSESQYDEFSGYRERLFSDTPYDKDDAEADQIYEAIDERMDQRRKRQREEKLLEQMKKYRQERPKISDQFADLKRELATVAPEDWANIPDVGDHSLKYKQRKRAEVFTPLPDYIIDSARGSKATVTAIDPGSATPVAGTQSVAGMAEARGTVLSMKLDRMSDSVTGQTVVDPKGYLTDLSGIKITSADEIGDIKRARMLLSSVTSTNPKHGPGWIAAARVEELAGKIVQARKIIRQGCESCPDSEDVWLEAARLHTPENAKAILADAVKHIPMSVNIWLKAAGLETSDNQKKIVLRRALEFIPNSVKLWKTAIELEDADDARIMLARAVECVPHSVEMWLALARLETYENARRVLNQAREAIPTEPAIWITAAKLEEANDHPQMVDRIIERAIASLTQYEVVIDREYWLSEAEAAEKSGAPLTCGAIVKHTIHIGVEEEDRKPTWTDDAESCLSRGSVETARCIYRHALSVFPKSKDLWLSACQLEKEHGTSEALESMLKQAVQQCPRAEVLWLMAAKEKWLAGDVAAARTILQEAFDVNQNSEQIWLAAVKLEWENNEFERARQLLERARELCPSERVWMKSVLLERELGSMDRAMQLLDEAISRYPDFPKYYMMAGQYLDEVLHQPERAVEYYDRGLKRCPTSVPLWRLAIRFDEKYRNTAKARTRAELARLRLPDSPEIWLESVRLERRAGSALAASLMARALQQCPNSGILWAEEVLTADKAAQKSKSSMAVQRCDNDPHVITAVARLFQRDRKYDKARRWFARAVALDPDLGDAWAYYYKFELQHGTPEQRDAVYQACVAAEPRHGELWTSFSKRTENRRLDTGTILKKIVTSLMLEEQQSRSDGAAESKSDTA